MLLKKNYKTAILSRGYKRKSKGFRIVEINDTVANAGLDLRLQKLTGLEMDKIKAEHAEIMKRIERFKEIDIIILDDGFQHKSIIAGFNILLTTYENIFFDDNLFPFGRLRDRKCESKRALLQKDHIALQELIRLTKIKS